MYINSLAKILHVRKAEIQSWIDKGWLEATVRTSGKRASYVITPEAFRALYTRHLNKLIAQKRIPSVALFEAFYSYFFVPKHTIGDATVDGISRQFLPSFSARTAGTEG